MLVESTRYTARDLEIWRARERADAVHAQTLGFRRRVERSIQALVSFADAGPCYAGTSWGKDSTALAHLVATHAPQVPLVWLRLRPWCNPDSESVRDAFLARCPVAYEERETRCDHDPLVECECWDLVLYQARSIAERHMSGVRAAESRARRMRMARWGESTEQTCAPIGWWTGADVFAYLHVHRLPVHPAYACSMGGALDRERIRVDVLGGERGRGHGRAEWEARYYGAVVG